MKRTGLRPVSRKRARRDRDYQKAREAVYGRSGGMCEARADAVRCRGICDQVHHIAGRGGRDPHRLDNLLGVCFCCHEWIETHRVKAMELGFLRSRHGGAA